MKTPVIETERLVLREVHKEDATIYSLAGCRMKKYQGICGGKPVMILRKQKGLFNMN